MQQGQNKYFMGTNSSIGFYSLFDEIYDPFQDNKAYIIKGGPGTGKSGIMKKVASKATKKGLDCDLVYCSSDPASLDAVIIPKLKVCVIDGTAPHVMEPKFVGCVEELINIGQYWDSDKLHNYSDEIRALYLENSAYHQRAQKFLSASSALLADSKKIVSQNTDYDKLSKYTIRLARREMGCEVHDNKSKKRLLTGVTPDGVITFEETIKNNCERVIAIDDNIGDVSERVLELLSEYAQGCGYGAIICPSPTTLSGVDQLLIPELSLAFVREQTINKIVPVRKIHSRRFMDAVELKNHKYRISFNKKAANDLQNEAIKLLKQAKETHDSLEQYYRNAMNFDGVNEETEKLIKKIGL